MSEGKHSDRLQLLETSIGILVRFRKRLIMTKFRSLHFCLLSFRSIRFLMQFAMFDRKMTLSHQFDYFLLKIVFIY